MGRIKISSPDSNVTGSAYLTVEIARPRIILVNGHWNKLMHKLKMGPPSGGEEYWRYFLRGNFNNFISTAQTFFGDSDYQSYPYYIDGSSQWGGDQNGEQRKNKGFQYAQKNFDELIRGIGKRKIYIISHSEGCAFAAGVAKYLVEKGIRIGESVMLATDEGDEFSVEGNYPCYQIVAGWVSNYQEANTRKQKTVFAIDPIVGDHMVKGVDKYGVYIEDDSSAEYVHGEVINVSIFAKMTQLKAIAVRQMFNKDGSISYFADPDPNQIWHKINERYMHNKRIDTFSHNHKKMERKD